MGVMQAILGMFFGGGRNALAETVEIFKENEEAAAVRMATHRQAALGQFAAEFAVERKGVFDRLMDGLNRVPRPAMALGTIGLFVAAMSDPIWFASRMQGVALVPEPLWWLMGAIVSFYFGERYQAKGQQFQRSLAETVARANDVTANIAKLNALADSQEADMGPGESIGSADWRDNPALKDWRAGG